MAKVTPTGADLAVSKTVDTANPSEGDTITLTNSGPEDATGVEVTDDLPEGVTFGSSSAGSYNSGTVVWTVGSLANDSNAALTITATVDAGTAGTTITNTVSITASDPLDPGTTNNSASADFTVAVEGGGTGTVQGRVTNADTGQKISGAKVTVDLTGQFVLTNNGGKYTLEGVPKGAQNITASAAEFENLPLEVTVSANDTVKQDYELIPVP